MYKKKEVLDINVTCVINKFESYKVDVTKYLCHIVPRIILEKKL